MTTGTKAALWIVGLLVVAIGAYAYITRDNDTTENGNATSTDSTIVACTMDAKMCPDGSYVGRTGPKCEFSPCPTGTTSGGGVSASVTTSGGVTYPADIGK